MLLYKPFHDIPTEIDLSAEIIIENWRKFRYQACHVQNPSIVNNIEDEEYGDFSYHDFQEWHIFSHLVPPNDVNVYDLHTLG